MYKLKLIDNLESDIQEVLAELHTLTFFDTAPVYDFSAGWWWLAYANNDIKEEVGFCGLTKGRTINTGYLCRSGVLPKHRGYGLQRRMIRVRERFSKKLGFTRLVTDTLDNIQSSNNLIKSGYLMYTPEIPWGLAEAAYWQKDLV